MTRESLSAQEEDRLRKTIGKNIDKLRAAIGEGETSQAAFAELSGTTTPSLSNYINGKRLPPVGYLAGLVQMPSLLKEGVHCTVDMLFSPDFDPAAIKQRKQGKPNALSEEGYGDLIGAYLCYETEQGQDMPAGVRERAPLRYGVLSVYDDYDSIRGQADICVCACFFPEAERDRVTAMKQELEKAFSQSEKLMERNRKIAAIYAAADAALYAGDLLRGGGHCYITMQSGDYGDCMFLSFFDPPKRKNTPYLGGLCSLQAVTRGAETNTAMQRMILTRYELTASEDEILPHLSRTRAEEYHAGAEGDALYDLCKQIFDPRLSLAEEDATAFLRGFFERTVNCYAQKHICGADIITRKEDEDVYRLILSSRRE